MCRNLEPHGANSRSVKEDVISVPFTLVWGLSSISSYDIYFKAMLPFCLVDEIIGYCSS